MSITGDAKAYYNYLTQINQQNNAASAKQAQKQMEFQEMMSSSAHTREVRDLKNAGLNPVLSVGSGSGGASSPSGAMGQTDMSTASALTGYLQSLIQQQTSIAVAQTQAAATRDAAAASAAATRYAADRAYQSAQDNANTYAAITRRFIDQFGLSDTTGKAANIAADAAADFVADVTGSKPDEKAVKILLHERQYNAANGIIDWFAAWDYFIHDYRGPVKWFGPFWEQVWPDMKKAGYRY